MLISSAMLLLALLAPAAPAPDPDRPASARTIRAAPLTGEIRLDGVFDEPVWNGAEAATRFTQFSPEPGAPATEATEARVLLDGDALYVALRMFDSRPDSIAAQLARRDASGIYSDWVHLMVDSYHDHRTAFRFSVNPRGVQKDVYHFDDGREDPSWDAVWEVATRIDSLGWTAEYRIPLSQLRFHAGDRRGDEAWGIGFQRDLARRGERSSWAPWKPTDAGFVSYFGDLVGVSDVRAARRMELRPYASSRVTRAPGAAHDPFHRATRMHHAMGADLQLGVTSGLTLSATLNPDFGQVEVDPAVVNLSAFETFFPEKRPFFVAGADIFRFGEVASFSRYKFQEFFYPRRIGRAPQRAIRGAEYVDAPEATTILGAAKVSGKAGRWSLGLMNAVTGAAEARFVEDGGAVATASVEPMSNYLVARARREMRAGRTVVGGMATATHRDLADPDLAGLLHSSAYLAGADFEHSWDDRAWTVSGYLAASGVQGDPTALLRTQRGSARYFQRPDADYLGVDSARTALAGYMGEVALRHDGAWDASVDLKAVSPGFEINDLGFQDRTDYRSVTTFLGRQFSEPGRVLRNAAVFGFSYHGWNHGGDRIANGIAVGSQATFSNLWNGGLRVRYEPAHRSDRLTRGGPAAEVPAAWGMELQAGTDPRRALSFRGGVTLREDAGGGFERSARVAADLRPSASLRLRLEPTLARTRTADQFVHSVVDPISPLGGRRYVFAGLDQTTASLDTRVDWTFSPTLSLQVFAQPFASSGDYSGYKEFTAPGGRAFARYGVDRGTVDGFTVDPDGDGPAASFRIPDSPGSRDFNLASVRGNAVLRWEYRPGSALFLVWQQDRSHTGASGGFDADRDFGAAFRAPARNVFMLKATYWLGG